MKLDFDTFEFAGLVAPGIIIVLASLLVWPQLIRGDNATVIIVLAILASYLVGHLVAAVGNIIDPMFKVFVRGLDSCPYDKWVLPRKYIATDQITRLKNLVTTNLYRDGLDWAAFEKSDSVERKTVVRQMYLAVAKRETQRVTTFDGLYSLSRGITVSLFMCALAAISFDRIGLASLCLGGACLAVYRMVKFKRVSCRELLQQFLLENEPEALGRLYANSGSGPAFRTRSSVRSEAVAEFPLGE